MPDSTLHFLRAIERPKDSRDFPLAAITQALGRGARPAVNMPDHSFLVQNWQSSTPFCGEHAGSHLKPLLDFYLTSQHSRKSPRYGTIKLKGAGSPLRDPYPIEAGTDMRSVFKWLQQAGAAAYEPLENDVSLAPTTYSDYSLITPAIDADASANKIASYAFDETPGGPTWDTIADAIWVHKAVLLLIKCDDGFWTGPDGVTKFTERKYGHFVVGDGYDDTQGILRIIDSTQNGILHKTVAKQYVTPLFFIECGTAVDLPPSVHQALSAGQITLAQQILADMAQILKNDLSILKQKVAPTSAPA